MQVRSATGKFEFPALHIAFLRILLQASDAGTSGRIDHLLGAMADELLTILSGTGGEREAQ
jgi:hypothetical protein